MACTQSRIGTIREVHGPVVTVACDILPPLHQALLTGEEGNRYVLEVHQHIDERHLRAIALHGATSLKRGLLVYDSGAPIQVPISPNCLGRLLNIFGESLDEAPPLQTTKFRNILARPIPLHESSAKRRHMDGALNKLREDEDRLRRLSNSLRQETVTEGLEVIMLSVESGITQSNSKDRT